MILLILVNQVSQVIWVNLMDHILLMVNLMDMVGLVYLIHLANLGILMPLVQFGDYLVW